MFKPKINVTKNFDKALSSVSSDNLEKKQSSKGFIKLGTLLEGDIDAKSASKAQTPLVKANTDCLSSFLVGALIMSYYGCSDEALSTLKSLHWRSRRYCQ